MTSNSSPATPSKPKAKQITNPRRLLILSPTTHSVSIIPSLLHALTDVPVHDLPQEQAVATPSTPPNDTAPTSFAGYTTHSPLHLNTKYYSAEIPLWVDEVPLPDLNLNSIPTDETKPTTWRTEFLSDEAEIVRDAVGALLVCVKNPSETDPRPGSDPASRADVRALLDLMREIGAVKDCIDEERGGMGDVPGVFVLVGTAKSAVPESGSERERDEMGLGVEQDMGTDDAPFSPGWWEDMLYDLGCIGWEVVEWDPRGQGEKTKNKFGEYEGMPRIKEVLETHDWTGPGDMRDDAEQVLDDEFEDDLETGLLGGGKSRTRGFGHEVHELEREMLGLRMAIEHGGSDGEDVDFGDFEDGDDEIKVESMEGLMMRVQAIRDMGADLPENERKKFAAKAVHDLMREL